MTRIIHCLYNLLVNFVSNWQQPKSLAAKWNCYLLNLVLSRKFLLYLLCRSKFSAFLNNISENWKFLLAKVKNKTPDSVQIGSSVTTNLRQSWFPIEAFQKFSLGCLVFVPVKFLQFSLKRDILSFLFECWRDDSIEIEDFVPNFFQQICKNQKHFNLFQI